MLKRILLFASTAHLLTAATPPDSGTWATPLAAAPQDVFISGTENYHTFRIPSIILSKRGTLLAFCEGRVSGRKDSGDIDVVMRRSTDRGQTWSKLQVVWNDQDNTCGNPTPVLDETTGRIWLALTWNFGGDTEDAIKKGQSRSPRKIFLSYSDDDGRTWSAPEEKPDLRQPRWRWYATGPDKGIQLTRGAHRGRLLIPCNHSDHSDASKDPYRSHVIYSDDHGKNWKLGGVLDEKTNESTIVELADGSVMDNMRSYHGRHRRAVAISRDGGESWGAVSLDETLIEPVCQASILRVSWPGRQRGRIAFSNPASESREKLTLRISYDEGKTWAVSRQVYAGSSAYSSLTLVSGNAVGVLFERDDYARITFAQIEL